MPGTPKYLPLLVSHATPDDGPGPVKRGSLASVDGESEGAALILQERLELFFRSMFVVSLGFAVLALAASVSTGIATFQAYLTHPSNELHQLTNLFLLAVTMLFRFARLSRPTLERLDPIFCVMVTSLFGWLFCISDPGGRPELVASLTTLTVCILRAVLIPSTTSRTLVVTAIAAAPSIVVAWIVHRETTALTGAGFHQTRVSVTLYTGIWWLVQVVVATLTTRVIYGLRQRVREARQLGQYTLEEKLGEGGMGVVYRASHALLRRPTAVKLLVRERAGDRAIQRFEREVSPDRASHASQHRHHLRLRPHPGGRFLLRHGASRRHRSRGARQDGWPTAARARMPHPSASCGCAGRGTRHRADSPRRQTCQHHALPSDRACRHCQAARLRARARARQCRQDAQRHSYAHWHAALHGAGIDRESS